MIKGWLKRCRDARYPFYCLGILAGLALIWWPYSTQRNLDEWAVQLRQQGTPAEAVIYDQVTKSGGNRSPNSETMHVRYDFADQTRVGEVGCWDVCWPAGTPVRIWVNPADPGDFVAEFGTLSGNRGRIQGGFGAAGFVLTVVSIGATILRLNQGRDNRLDRRRKTVLATHQPARTESTRRRTSARRKHKS